MYPGRTLSGSMALLHIDHQKGGKLRLARHSGGDKLTSKGPRALYKGASVPAISWGITDSILMGRQALGSWLVEDREADI